VSPMQRERRARLARPLAGVSSRLPNLAMSNIPDASFAL